MAVDVLLGKLDADGKYPNGNDNASELEGNAFDIAFPQTGVEDFQPVRTWERLWLATLKSTLLALYVRAPNARLTNYVSRQRQARASK